VFWHDGCMDEQQLIRQQINEARRDFAIEDDLDFLTSRIAWLPTVKGSGAHCAQHHQPSCRDDNLTREE
jgi:hypothetical protein